MGRPLGEALHIYPPHDEDDQTYGYRKEGIPTHADEESTVWPTPPIDRTGVVTARVLFIQTKLNHTHSKRRSISTSTSC